MAVQYGAAIRAPAKKSNLSSDDPQQQALLDAMGQNGAPDPQQSIDQLPRYRLNDPNAGPGSFNGEPSRTTMPVPPQQPQSPQVGGGVSSSGTLNGSSQSGPMTGPLGTRSSTVGGSASNQFPSGLPSGLTNGPNGYSVDPRAQQNSLNFLAPPTTGSVSPQFPDVTPANLTQFLNQQTQQQNAAGPAGGAQSQASGGLGQFAGSMQGFDSGKLNDPNKHDPKYDFARVMSQFDPRQGVTPELLAKLNALGYGQVSGSGDKVHIDNPSAAFNGLSDFDIVQGMNGGDGQWAWQPMGGDTGGGAAPTGGAAPQAQGDPLTQLSQLQTQASGGDGYSQMVLKYLMQQLGLDQGMLQHSQ